MNTKTDPQAQPQAVLSSAELGKLYADRDHAAQGEHYMRHIDAMTREGLHAKSDIAGELAHRDIEIERLRAVLERIGSMDPATDSVEGYNEWGQADCFNQAQSAALMALGPNTGSQRAAEGGPLE